MHSSPTTDNSVSSFSFYVICVFNTGNKVLSNSLAYQGYLIPIYLQDIAHLISYTSQIPSCAIFFSSFALAGNSCICVFLLFISTGRADLYLYFYIKCFSFSVEILSFNFFLVNSEWDAYLPVDHIVV